MHLGTTPHLKFVPTILHCGMHTSTDVDKHWVEPFFPVLRIFWAVQ